jgi:hypothetical protein
MYSKFLSQNLKGRDHAEDLGVGGRIILEWVFREIGRNLWTVYIWLRIGPVAGSCEYGNEPSSSIKAGKFLTE